MTPGLRIEPGTPYLEASALTTASTLLPCTISQEQVLKVGFTYYRVIILFIVLCALVFWKLVLHLFRQVVH